MTELQAQADALAAQVPFTPLFHAVDSACQPANNNLGTGTAAPSETSQLR